MKDEFAKWDVNCDRHLSFEELAGKKVFDTRVNAAVFAKMDRDNSGAVTINEIVRYAFPNIPDKDVRRLFRRDLPPAAFQELREAFAAVAVKGVLNEERLLEAREQICGFRVAWHALTQFYGARPLGFAELVRFLYPSIPDDTVHRYLMTEVPDPDFAALVRAFESWDVAASQKLTLKALGRFDEDAVAERLTGPPVLPGLTQRRLYNLIVELAKAAPVPFMGVARLVFPSASDAHLRKMMKQYDADQAARALAARCKQIEDRERLERALHLADWTGANNDLSRALAAGRAQAVLLADHVAQQKNENDRMQFCLTEDNCRTEQKLAEERGWAAMMRAEAGRRTDILVGLCAAAMQRSHLLDVDEAEAIARKELIGLADMGFDFLTRDLHFAEVNALQIKSALVSQQAKRQAIQQDAEVIANAQRVILSIVQDEDTARGMIVYDEHRAACELAAHEPADWRFPNGLGRHKGRQKNYLMQLLKEQDDSVSVRQHRAASERHQQAVERQQATDKLLLTTPMFAAGASCVTYVSLPRGFGVQQIALPWALRLTPKRCLLLGSTRHGVGPGGSTPSTWVVAGPVRSKAPGAHAHGNTERQVVDCLRTEVGGQSTTVKRPPQPPAQPQYANYWAPLPRKRHIPPHPAQPQHTNHWAPQTRKRHQQEHRPQRPTERSDPTQHAKGRTGDCPGPRKETTTRRNVTQGGKLPSYVL